MKSDAIIVDTAKPNVQQHEPTKLNHIDLLRGVAVIMVVVTHVALADAHLNPFVRVKLLFGQTGVQLFFFLSAYTLCLSMFERKENNQIRNFYLRRFFRIAPLYYVFMLVYFIVTKVALLNQNGPLLYYPSFGKKNVLLNVLFLHGFHIKAYNYTVPGGWSISTEMIFYVMFPFIFALFTKVKKAAVYILFPIAALIIANLYMGVAYLKYSNMVFTEHFFYAFILNQLPVFIVGITFFFLDKKGLIKISKTVSLIAFIVLFAVSYKLMGYLTHNISLPIFLVSISFGFLFVFFKNSDFKMPLLRRIGQLSYSIYICHFLFAYPLADKISRVIGDKINGNLVFLLNLVITIVLSVITAMITEKLVEKPGINLGKRVIKKLNTSAA